MSIQESRDYGLLERLADEFAERHRKGEKPTVQEYVDRHPSLAEDLRDMLPAMAAMEGVQEAVATATPPAGEARVLGDFRILREIGRGGMGVVYEAEQISLGRRVALKLLTQKLLTDAKQKRRFEREARAAAKLHHTNIVPVFGFGENDGTPFYVMQFIQGLGLEGVIGELAGMGPAAGTTATINRSGREVSAAAAVAASLLTGTFHKSDLDEPEQPVGMRTLTGPLHPTNADSDSAPTAPIASDSSATSSSSATLPGQGGSRKATYWQSVARVGAQVADALDYAHKQGIIHRDIKPSNLLLDMTGTVWVADFGLAKADDSQDLTHTGDILGTLRYMPPEAFEGKADARGDVYALGLTLYEMLALKPAFDEKDRNRLIKQVTQAELPPLRKVRAEVPRDLETIVAKATERDVGRRYQTAGELADDLQRFIADEPIRARRQTTTEAAWRWARRHPGTAALAGAILLMMVGVTVASVLAARHFDRLAKAAEQTAISERTAKENEAKERAEANRLRQEADRQIARQYTEAANRLQADGDIAGALLWNVKALEANPEQADAIRTRIGLMLPQAPLPIHSLFLDGATSSFSIDPKGRTVAVTMADGRIHVYDLQKGTRLHTLADRGQLLQSAYSRDGMKLLTVHGEKPQAPSSESSRRKVDKTPALPKVLTVRVWDVQTGKMLTPPISSNSGDYAGWETGRVGAACFCLDDTRIAVPTSPSSYTLFDTSTGKEVKVIAVEKDAQLLLIRVGADGKRLIFLETTGNQATAGNGDANDGPATISFSVHDLETNTRWVPELPERKRTVTAGGPPSPNRFASGSKDIDFSPDGGSVLVSSNESARLFTAHGKQIWQWSRPDVPVGPGAGPFSSSFANRNSFGFSHRFSPDGRLLVFTDSKGTHVLDTSIPTRKPVELESTITELCDLGPKGHFLLARSQDRYAIFDTSTGRAVSQFSPYDLPGGATFSPDGKQVIASGNGLDVKVFDAVTVKRSLPLLNHEAPVSRTECTPDGSRIGTLTGTTLRVWPLARAERAARTLEVDAGPNDYVNFALSPDGSRIVTAVSGQETWSIQTWDSASGKPIHEPVTMEIPEEDRAPIGSFAANRSQPVALSRFSASGDRLLVSRTSLRVVSNGPALPGRYIFDLSSGKLRSLSAEKTQDYDGYWVPRLDLDWSPGGDAALQSCNYSITRISPSFQQTGSDVVGPPKPTPEKPRSSIALFTPDGDPIGEPILFPGRVAHAWSADGRHLVVSSLDKKMWKSSLWEFQAGKPLRFILAFPEVPDTGTGLNDDFSLAPLPLLSFSSNGTRVLFTYNPRQDFSVDTGFAYTERTLRIWDVSTGKQVGPLERLEKTNAAPVLSPDGAALYAAVELQQNPGVQAIEPESGKPLLRLMVPAERMRGFTLSPDGKRVLTWGLKSLQLWDARTGKLLPAPLANEGTISRAEFSANGKRVIASIEPGNLPDVLGLGGFGGLNRGSRDIRIWDTATGQTLLAGLGESASAVHDREGTRVLRTARARGSISVHDLTPDARPLEKLRELVESLASREVSGGAGLVVLDAADVADRWARSAAHRGDWGTVATDSQWHADQLPSVDRGRAFMNGPGQPRSFNATNSIALSGTRWHLDRYLQLNPGDTPRRVYRANLARESGEWAQVVADLRDEKPGQTASSNLTVRGSAYAELGEFEKARVDFAAGRPKTMPKMPPKDNAFTGLLVALNQLAPALQIALIDWKIGKEEALKRFSNEALSLLDDSGGLPFGGGPNNMENATISLMSAFLWPSLLIAEQPSDKLVKVMERMTIESAGMRSGATGAMIGSLPIPIEEALAYRQGKADQVVNKLEPQFNARDGCTIPQCLFLAMAAKKAGRDELAKQALERGIRQIQQAEEDPKLLQVGTINPLSRSTLGGTWQVRIAHEILLREAEAVVRGGK